MKPQRGIANIVLLIGVVLVSLVIPITRNLVQRGVKLPFAAVDGGGGGGGSPVTPKPVIPPSLVTQPPIISKPVTPITKPPEPDFGSKTKPSPEPKPKATPKPEPKPKTEPVSNSSSVPKTTPSPASISNKYSCDSITGTCMSNSDGEFANEKECLLNCSVSMPKDCSDGHQHNSSWCGGNNNQVVMKCNNGDIQLVTKCSSGCSNGVCYKQKPDTTPIPSLSPNPDLNPKTSKSKPPQLFCLGGTFKTEADCLEEYSSCTQCGYCWSGYNSGGKKTKQSPSREIAPLPMGYSCTNPDTGLCTYIEGGSYSARSLCQAECRVEPELINHKASPTATKTLCQDDCVNPSQCETTTEGKCDAGLVCCEQFKTRRPRCIGDILDGVKACTYGCNSERTGCNPPPPPSIEPYYLTREEANAACNPIIEQACRGDEGFYGCCPKDFYTIDLPELLPTLNHGEVYDSRTLDAMTTINPPSRKVKQIPPEDYFGTYKSSVFMNLIEDYLSENPLNSPVIANWENATAEAKIQELSNFLHRNIPYAPELTAIKQQLQVGLMLAENLPYATAFKPLVESYVEISYEHQLENFWEEKLKLSPLEQFQQDMFVCYNYTDLLSVYSQEYIPEATVYAAGVPGHAFMMFEIYEGNELILKTIDPTWGTSIRNLEESSTNYNLTEAGYNPILSSDNVSQFIFDWEIEKVLSPGLPAFGGGH